MNDNSKKQLIVRWMDGESMTDEELQRLELIEQESPEDLLDPTEFSLIRKQMKEAFSVEADMPNGDLFNTLLERRISREDEEVVRQEELQQKIVHLTNEKTHLLDGFKKVSWIPLVGSAAACLVCGVLLGKLLLDRQPETLHVAKASSSSIPLTPVVYPVDDALSINFSREKQCNVIVVEGLEALPDDFDLFKYSNKIEAIKVQPNRTYQTN